MTVIIDGTSGIDNNATDLSYTGTLTGGTGVVNLGSGQVYKDASGNLGVGTSSPTAVFKNYKSLYLNGSSGSAIQMQSNGGLASNIVADTNALYLQNITAITFNTGGTGTGTERARIDSSGNLSVGRTSGGGRVNIQANTNNFMNEFFNQSGGSVGSIQTNGTTTSYNTTSDYRLKESVQPMQGALAKVAALKPVTYKWKSDGSDSQGFIAHELQAVVPDCVVGEKDAVDAEGNPQYQGIDTSFLVATLTAAIQELKAIVDTQAISITALNERLTALEAPIV